MLNGEASESEEGGSTRAAASAASPSPPRFDAAYVEHLSRCWDAECENASRLDTRHTLILSAIAAIVGIAVYQLQLYHARDDVPTIRDWRILIAIRGLLFVALTLLAICFYGLMGALDGRWRRLRYSSAGFYLLLWRNAPPENVSDSDKLMRWARGVIATERTARLAARSAESPLGSRFRHRSSHLLLFTRDEIETLPEDGDEAREAVFDRLSEAHLDLVFWNDRKAKQLARWQSLFLYAFGLIVVVIAIYLLAA